MVAVAQRYLPHFYAVTRIVKLVFFLSIQIAVHTQIHTHTHIYLYVCVCVCVCVGYVGDYS